jgi:ribonuclease BN (tRNA processing enzyme)
MSGETLHVYFLGTAGALPTPLRNPPCIMIKRGPDTLLFDCGEGAQQQMMRARTGFLVDAIFITHWHADHFLGSSASSRPSLLPGERPRSPYTAPNGCMKRSRASARSPGSM